MTSKLLKELSRQKSENQKVPSNRRKASAEWKFRNPDDETSELLKLLEEELPDKYSGLYDDWLCEIIVDHIFEIKEALYRGYSFLQITEAVNALTKFVRSKKFTYLDFEKRFNVLSKRYGGFSQ